MLQLRNIFKSYTTGDFTQVALDDVSISFRSNEFVAVLGPSGSGKTTLLNIVGGLDQYDSGDLVIDGVSTKKYTDRDWDTYRNNRVGFVFQSYNLIPHQSVLANVELALTLSGVSREERRRRAFAALEEVGLAEHAHKRPSQLSGGQMQRVAIARALINDPEILLADEPTGALDSKTSEQIMGLLTEIAGDRLVIMVTHNGELAEEYATRIVSLADGRVSADSDPYLAGTADSSAAGKTKKTSMSFLTAIALSFNNLMTKKGRTLMTAFAGSIGIIGIAAILALASGVNDYIKNVEEEMLSVYPLTIQSQGFDFTALLGTAQEELSPDADLEPEEDGGIHEVQMLARTFSSIGQNDLAALKRFLDQDGGGIDSYVNAIQYSYSVTPQIYTDVPGAGVRQVNPDTTFSQLGFGGGTSEAFMGPSMSMNAFSQVMEDTSLIEPQYDVVAGRWPEKWDELVLVLTPNGGASDFVLYSMGLLDAAELDSMVENLIAEKQVPPPPPSRSFSTEQILSTTFKLVDAPEYYVRDAKYNLWVDKRDDAAHLERIVKEADELRIVGIVQTAEGATASALSPGIYYTPSLIERIVAESRGAPIVRQQLAEPKINVFTGQPFEEPAAGLGSAGFDMESLVTIDEEAIQSAFAFDEGALQIDASAFDLNLPNLSFTDFDIALPPPPSLSLADLLQGIDLDVNEGEVAEVAAELVQAYFTFVQDEGLDPTDIETNFPLFLESPSGVELQEKLAEAADLPGLEKQIEQNLSQQMGSLMGTYMATMSQQIGAQIGTQMQQALGSLEEQLAAAMEATMGQLAENMASALAIDEAAFQAAFEFNLDEEELTELLLAMVAAEQASFEANLARLGYADFNDPSAIDIYPIDFQSKEHVVGILDQYNKDAEAAGEDDLVVTYTDVVGTLMSSVTDIINVITYVLVAFVAISLVVSSIMIGVITYISVLERRKEIGILRSIGASKRDIRRVFNAETLIVGFVAGVLGISITWLLTIPVNAIIKARFGIAQVAQLPWQAALLLVLISMGLTVLAGLIPSSAASRKDPVEALRSE